MTVRRLAPRAVGAAVAGALVVLAVLASLAIGARAIDPLTIVSLLLGSAVEGAGLGATGLGAAQVDAIVIVELRIPRTLIGLAAGAALGLAGAVMQGVTRNPIADPGLLGVNAGASFAVVVAISALGVSSPLGIATGALLGALLASVLIAIVAASTRSFTTPAVLVVAGAAVTAGLTSLTTLVLLSDPAALDRYRFWTVGSLTGRDLELAAALLPLLLLGGLLAALLARPLDALALGDDVARGLGFRLRTTRGLSLASIVLLCGTATALAGPLVFVGLLAAHAARALVGTRHGVLLPTSALLGASALLVTDALGRVVAPPAEIEVGIVIAVLGAPLLIALVRSARVTV